jgi:hypothetical protein
LHFLELRRFNKNVSFLVQLVGQGNFVPWNDLLVVGAIELMMNPRATSAVDFVKCGVRIAGRRKEAHGDRD